ncbi:MULTISPECIES: NADPH-dependent FMN reductase [Pseudidiomarina]|uniref:NAD(P)H-dependent FMN reductase n=4 Tax=Pseudidiomarina TaxID=2800384 RepID=A0A368UNG2_9GAMM|nr:MULTISPECIES: NADPH-dependent FMN reductase [Pseudidiomarina]MDT7526057.1 NAD(P)H-dependent oxidoreductase [Pseudidiomarina sp. GXY010]MDX1526148.1 NADPH-dependent FMN reductase [Pseudidiomarina maritima]PWW07574.1 NAD(P)H-dependent FMN reductase [Pseudidiomarina maritima]RBP86755.1 NAD(P)H-dependent FMN reductase [Pseudidiomarina tainanensis]RCW28944.1 NAD(P)H-dependent FMN reductase [Pseudidiomarina tainanensis]
MSLLIIAGSSREDSINAVLQQRIAAVATAAGEACHLYAAADLDAPLYQGDYEQENGVPSNIQKLATAINDVTKVIIVSPEYNSSIPPLLKNAIDWSTRLPQNPWQGKTVLLAGAAPGRLGCMRVLTHLNTVMSAVQSWVAPMFLSCANASAESLAEFDQAAIESFIAQGG